MSTPVPERTSVNTAQPPPSLAVAKELIAGTAGGTAQVCYQLSLLESSFLTNIWLLTSF